MTEIETVLNDQLVLSRIRNAANWILGPQTGHKKSWAGTLLQCCEYLEKRLQFNEVVINNPGKVIINQHDNVAVNRAGPELSIDDIEI